MGSLLLVWALLATASGVRSPSMEMLLQTGRSRVVVEQVSAALEQDPDDAELHALLGIAWSRSGYFADAIGEFALSGGAAVYEDLGLEAHAAAIRACQGGEAAVALRLQRLLTPLPVNVEHRVWMNAADDLREVGALDGAEALALKGYAAFPASSVMAALLADLALDRDLPEEADFYIWLAGREGGGPRLDAVRIRRALLDGNVQEALVISEAAQVFSSGSTRLGAMRAEALRQSGDPEAALAFLDRTRWRLSEDPDLLAVRVRVLLDLGQAAAARELGARLAVLSGHLLVVQEALAQLPASGVQ